MDKKRLSVLAIVLFMWNIILKLGDIGTTWFAINYTGAREANILPLKLMNSLGMNWALLIVFFVHILCLCGITKYSKNPIAWLTALSIILTLVCFNNFIVIISNLCAKLILG